MPAGLQENSFNEGGYGEPVGEPELFAENRSRAEQNRIPMVSRIQVHFAPKCLFPRLARHLEEQGVGNSKERGTEQSHEGDVILTVQEEPEQ